MLEPMSIGDRLGVKAAVKQAVAEQLGLHGAWLITCRDKSGRIKWRDTIDNLVTNAGESYILDTGLSGGSPITSWFIGLTDGTPTVSEADTAASHAGWTEVTAYTEATREAFIDGGESGQSIDNSASVASYAINSDATTVGGAFLVSLSTKGGSTGTLYSAGAFSGGDKSVDDGDTLEVTATFTAGGA